MTGLRNTEYLHSLFSSHFEMAEKSGISIDTCKKIMYSQTFQPLVIHFQALLHCGVDVNKLLTVEIEA